MLNLSVLNNFIKEFKGSESVALFGDETHKKDKTPVLGGTRVYEFLISL